MKKKFLKSKNILFQNFRLRNPNLELKDDVFFVNDDDEFYIRELEEEEKKKKKRKVLMPKKFEEFDETDSAASDEDFFESSSSSSSSASDSDSSVISDINEEVSSDESDVDETLRENQDLVLVLKRYSYVPKFVNMLSKRGRRSNGFFLFLNILKDIKMLGMSLTKKKKKEESEQGYIESEQERIMVEIRRSRRKGKKVNFAFKKRIVRLILKKNAQKERLKRLEEDNIKINKNNSNSSLVLEDDKENFIHFIKDPFFYIDLCFYKLWLFAETRIILKKSKKKGKSNKKNKMKVNRVPLKIKYGRSIFLVISFLIKSVKYQYKSLKNSTPLHYFFTLEILTTVWGFSNSFERKKLEEKRLINSIYFMRFLIFNRKSYLFRARHTKLV